MHRRSYLPHLHRRLLIDARSLACRLLGYPVQAALRQRTVKRAMTPSRPGTCLPAPADRRPPRPRVTGNPDSHYFARYNVVTNRHFGRRYNTPEGKVVDPARLRTPHHGNDPPRAVLPGNGAGGVEVTAGGTVGCDGSHAHDDFSALLDGLGAAVAVEVGSGVAGVDRVYLDRREGLRVLRGEHVQRRLGGGVGQADQGRLEPARVGRDCERAHAAADVDHDGGTAGLQERQEGVHDADDAEDVGVVDGLHVGGGDLARVFHPPADAGVVDQDVEVACLGADERGGGVDGLVAGDVDQHRVGTEFAGRLFAALLVT